MANRRMINKSISLSAQVNSLSNEAKILFTWAIPHFDDEGRMRGESQFVKASVVPLSNWSAKRVDKLIEEICKAGLWDKYDVDGMVVLQGVKWLDHQRIQPTRFRASQLPAKAKVVLGGIRKSLEDRGVLRKL